MARCEGIDWGPSTHLSLISKSRLEASPDGRDVVVHNCLGVALGNPSSKCHTDLGIRGRSMPIGHRAADFFHSFVALIDDSDTAVSLSKLGNRAVQDTEDEVSLRFDLVYGLDLYYLDKFMLS